MAWAICGSNLNLCIDDLNFEDPVTPTYSVTYHNNTSTSGGVPTDGSSYESGNAVTLLGNTGSLVKTGYTFTGWNTQAGGGGTDYDGEILLPWVEIM